jgi:hypothetical protein
MDETSLNEDNPHYGCDALNPICKPPLSGSTAQCVCSGADMTCTISESTRCVTPDGTKTDPMYGTCMCGSDPTCTQGGVIPRCFVDSSSTEPDIGIKSGTSCQVHNFFR